MLESLNIYSFKHIFIVLFEWKFFIRSRKLKLYVYYPLLIHLYYRFPSLSMKNILAIIPTNVYSLSACIYILIGKCLSVCVSLIPGDGTSYDHEIWRVRLKWLPDGASKFVGHTKVKFKSCGQTLKLLWITWISGYLILLLFGTFS